MVLWTPEGEVRLAVGGFCGIWERASLLECRGASTKWFIKWCAISQASVYLIRAHYKICRPLENTPSLAACCSPSHRGRPQQVLSMLVSADFSADVMLNPYAYLTATQLLEYVQ